MLEKEVYTLPSTKNTEMLSEIVERINGAGAIWVVDACGLTVKQSQELRRAVRGADAQMVVYKNTIMHLALEQTESPNMDTILAGPSAFVFTGEDPVAAAKVLRDFAKENEILEIKGGIMDGQFLDAAQVMEVAALPSREELIAKLLGTISNPLVKTVRVLNGPMEAFARVVNAIADQKQAA